MGKRAHKLTIYWDFDPFDGIYAEIMHNLGLYISRRIVANLLPPSISTRINKTP
jgi:hypothetical protein